MQAAQRGALAGAASSIVCKPVHPIVLVHHKLRQSLPALRCTLGREEDSATLIAELARQANSALTVRLPRSGWPATPSPPAAGAGPDGAAAAGSDGAAAAGGHAPVQVFSLTSPLDAAKQTKLYPSRFPFEPMYEQLRRWQGRHVSAHVPRFCFDAPALGAWVRFLRKQRKLGQLEQWKVDRCAPEA